VTNGGRRLQEAIQNQTHNLPHSSVESKSQRQTPPLLDVHEYLADDAPGLLFLPGRFPELESVGQYSLRRSNEKRMLAAAFLRGCPILAVCDGALVIWEMQGGTTTSVSQHSYGRMPAITPTGKIGWNITMHRLKIDEGSLLEAAMTEKPPNALPEPLLECNSVHRSTISSDRATIPDHWKISAWAENDPEIRPKSYKRVLSPEDGVPEAAETKNGAPILIVQWHPEAYQLQGQSKIPDVHIRCHQSMVGFMGKAGRAYQEGRRVVQVIVNWREECISRWAFANEFSRLTVDGD